VTAVGVGPGTPSSAGTTVTATSNAVAVVRPISVACQIILSGNALDSSTAPCPTLIFTNAPNSPVTFTLIVTNTGAAPVSIAISNLPALVSCDNLTTPLPPPAPTVLPVGGFTVVQGCLFVSCPAGTNFNVAVQGTAVAGGTNCVFDSTGNLIRTGVSRCEACVQCPQIVTCRTTGGGTLIDGFTVGQNETNGTIVCTQQVTTLFPLVSATGLALNKVTHGGQLGAPYAQKDCGEILGNPCIRGQWQHVRHYQGKGNPRDVVDTVHTVTPKGEFDTLNCACLPCCTGAAGDVNQPNGNFFGQTNRFQLCNPEDHRICGPQPRPAPANALIWTGLGRSTPWDDEKGANAKNATWVVIRVYIEDRSEPGGGHPGGSIDPADVYVFQAWDTGIAVTKKPEAIDSVAADFRRLLARESCAFLDALQTGALPQGSLPPGTVGGLSADINDRGPLHDGNRQIHPSTSAVCTP